MRIYGIYGGLQLQNDIPSREELNRQDTVYTFSMTGRSSVLSMGIEVE